MNGLIQHNKNQQWIQNSSSQWKTMRISEGIEEEFIENWGNMEI